MNKPAKTSAPAKYVRMGVSVNVLLTQGQKAELAAQAQAATDDVKAKARIWEDAQHMASATRALKKACDADLDASARDIAFALSSRGREEQSHAPYTQIFHSGLGYYTEASAANELSVYSELALNVSTYLKAEDSILSTELPLLQTRIEAWKAVLAAVNEAETLETQARVALDEALSGFNATMDALYGTLFAELGRKGADRYFP